jgi:hypothetical protein
MLEATETIRGIMNTIAGVTPVQFNEINQAENLPATAADQLEEWVRHGFPRQVYMGKLSFDVYNKETVGQIPKNNGSSDMITVYKYTPVNAKFFADAAKVIRTKLSRHRLVYRQLQDVANATYNTNVNPGGVADATKTVGG